MASIRSLAKLNFQDPAPLLVLLRQLERTPDWRELPDKVSRLRTNELNVYRQDRNAALFCHGMATLLGHKVFVAFKEDEDFDFVARWSTDGTEHYCPVQLKELPPLDLNPRASLEALFSSLTKYGPTCTVLAVLLNRPTQATIAPSALQDLPFAAVWLYWQASADGMDWKLQGDIKRDHGTVRWRYPT